MDRNGSDPEDGEGFVNDRLHQESGVTRLKSSSSDVDFCWGFFFLSSALCGNNVDSYCVIPASYPKAW